MDTQHISASGSAPASGALWRTVEPTTRTKSLDWQLAEETPVGILIGSSPVTVMMATPADLQDFGIGFLLAEGYIAGPEAIRRVLVLPTETGFCVDVSLDAAPLREVTPRTLEGRSGCGLCGMTDLTDVGLELAYRERPPLAAGAVARAFAGLAANQPMKAANHSVHGAAFARPDGEVVLVREDVGRHNALDKLIGALMRSDIDPASGFAVLSSRCSFELVQKAAKAGLGGLATISAPTTLALRMARQAGLPLASRAPGGVALF